MIVKFIVPGVPVGKGRPRVTKTHTYTPKRTKDYEQHVRECWMEQSNQKFPDDTPLELIVRAYFPIPKSVSKKKHREMNGQWFLHKPDLDNAVKIVADALNGYAYADDSRIAVVYAIKRYSEIPRAEIEITEI